MIRQLEENDFNFSSKWEELGLQLSVSLDDRQRVSVQAHMSQDFRSATEDVLGIWLKNQDPAPSWRSLVTALEECGQSSIASKMKKTLLLDEGTSMDI